MVRSFSPLRPQSSPKGLAVASRISDAWKSLGGGGGAAGGLNYTAVEDSSTTTVVSPLPEGLSEGDTALILMTGYNSYGISSSDYGTLTTVGYYISGSGANPQTSVYTLAMPDANIPAEVTFTLSSTNYGIRIFVFNMNGYTLSSTSGDFSGSADRLSPPDLVASVGDTVLQMAQVRQSIGASSGWGIGIHELLPESALEGAQVNANSAYGKITLAESYSPVTYINEGGTTEMTLAAVALTPT